MRRSKKVMGVEAPAVRPTALAAFLLALGLSVPVFLVLSLIGLLV